MFVTLAGISTRFLFTGGEHIAIVAWIVRTLFYPSVLWFTWKTCLTEPIKRDSRWSGIYRPQKFKYLISFTGISFNQNFQKENCLKGSCLGVTYTSICISAHTMSESLTVIFTHAYVNKLYLRKFNLLSVLLTDVMVITRIHRQQKLKWVLIIWFWKVYTS